MRLPLALLAATALAAPAFAQDTIAKTDAKTPAEERASFALPPGFEAQLVAAEPDIEKPIQLAFDAKGRLWVTTTRHYPFPAPAGKATDKLFVLSDFGADGKAKTVTTFASDLNIPIGVLPLPDCKSCLVSEVGRIRKLTDTDGDGKADKSEDLITGLGTKDTHGMTNSFVLLPDGWVYATHGFANDSTAKGTDGKTIRMVSGNTFRFRPDGTHVQNWTYGQVNPFGMAVDPWFNLYTADCHSKPITQLIRGAYYDSFGKPHDGLGFAPHVTVHGHGSTALCGLAWYDADAFPKEYKGCMFLGNVVTNRINADRIEWKGSTPVGKELPDFLTSKDPWFRPTDIKLGPDGALYVADFYNKIIGHYEVDLKHPQRDKDRGRVWRIVYRGADGKGDVAKPAFDDLTKLKEEDADKLLGHPNLTVRLLATHELIRRRDEGQKIGGREPEFDNSFLIANRNWVQFAPRTGKGNSTGKAFAVGEPMMKSHFLRLITACEDMNRIAGADPADTKPFKTPVPKDFHVRRAWVDHRIALPNAAYIAELVETLKTTSPDDTHLRQATKVALRNGLKLEGAWKEVETLPDELRPVIADIAVAVPTPESAAFLLKQLLSAKHDLAGVEAIGKFGTDSQAAFAVDYLAKTKSTAFATPALSRLVRGMQTRGGKLSADDLKTAEAVCATGLDAPDPGAVLAACELAGGLKLAGLFDPLAKLAGTADRPEHQRLAALAAFAVLNPEKSLPILAGFVADPAAPFPIREKAVQALAGTNRDDGRAALVAALPTVPARVAAVIAVSLAGSPQGAAALLDAVKAGKASPRLLQDKAVSTKLLAIENGKFRGRVEELTKGLPTADQRLADLIKKRGEQFRTFRADAELGKKAFSTHCAGCHQLGGQGAKVGPQLDGIGNRGADRLLEDVLDPNRNVDAAFRATQLQLADGRSLTGLLLREEGKTLVLADPAGKEVRVPADDVEKRALAALSPMPANFDTAVPEAEFFHLLAFLLDQRVKDVPK